MASFAIHGQQAVFQQADESFHVDGNSGRSCWTWLLWCDLLLRVDTVDSDTCQFDPFTRSARLMEEWGLNTNSPHPPDWLQVDLPDTGDGAGQPDDEVGDSGKPPVIKEPPKKAIQAYRLSILKGWSQEKDAVEFETNQGRVSRWLTATKGYIEAGNVLPRLEFMAKPTTVDPNVLGMGARPDGLTPRQHDNRSDDSAD